MKRSDFEGVYMLNLGHFSQHFSKGRPDHAVD